MIFFKVRIFYITLNIDTKSFRIYPCSNPRIYGGIYGNRWGQRIFRNLIATGILKENVHKMLPQKKKSDILQSSCPFNKQKCSSNTLRATGGESAGFSHFLLSATNTSIRRLLPLHILMISSANLPSLLQQLVITT